MLEDGSGPVPFFWVAAPAFNAQGRRLGIVALHVDTAYILAKIRSPLPQGRAYLVDQRGFLFYRSDGGTAPAYLSELHPRLAALLSADLDSVPYVACELEEGHSGHTYCMHGLKKIAYDPNNPEKFWAVVFDAPPKQVFAPVDAMRDRFLLWGGVIIGISLGLTFFLSQTVVVNPVLLLEKAARRIASGDLRPPLPPNSVRRDEIGQLYASFSSMVEKLRQATEHLEEEIQTRTAKLQASEAQLERQNLELKGLNTYKSHLLSVVSHELKTPLTSLDGFSRTINQVFLTDDFLTQFENGAKETLEKVRHRVEVMGKNAVRLTRLVNDLLDFSRLDQGRGLEINHNLVDLLPLIEAEVEACREMGFKKALPVHFQGPTSGQSLWATADADRIGQVLNNLLSNALKFTDGGEGIRVEAGFTEDFLECRVQDSGKGLEPEALERIFELFEQSGSQISRNQGTGIGLAISKYIIERHGGYIRAESTGLGHGSAFVFGIPRHKGEEQPAGAVDGIFATSADDLQSEGTENA
jgi:signal transduction histidine kinase